MLRIEGDLMPLKERHELLVEAPPGADGGPKV